ncbi:copper resistance protein B [Sphingobium sp. CR28]|uniref:copper resistance protein B n=1 Tax=Sphingobium sp. CR28 TaxID=3400272 RepID=UPI003FF0609C
MEGEMFLSNKGELTGRAEANYDLRLSQRVILQPAVELNFSAQDVEALRLGARVSSVELGARVRYEFAREFAPYLGIHWERKLGGTARFARAYGEEVGGLNFVAGVRLWF